MTMKVYAAGIAVIFLCALSFTKTNKSKALPLVAIASYGPHASLDEAIGGLKETLAREGFVESETVTYQMMDVGFDAGLIPQMIGTLVASRPKVMVVLTTPVAQFAKGSIQDIPLIYTAITDPVSSGLLHTHSSSSNNMSGSSDQQDLGAMLTFARKLLPHARRVGLLYATSESNDAALVRMMKEAAEKAQMTVVAIPVDQARDVPLRMQQFKGQVDFIYVGTSGPIQPTLPVIVAEAKTMGLPVLNADAAAVKEGLVLASFGVDYCRVGANAGLLTAQVLRGAPISTLDPISPSLPDHVGVINRRQAERLGLTIPHDLSSTTIVE